MKTNPNDSSKEKSLLWQAEIENGHYQADVAIVTPSAMTGVVADGITLHCEAFEDGRWLIWRYNGDEEIIVQEGKANSLQSAKLQCSQQLQSLEPQVLPHFNPTGMPSYEALYPSFLEAAGQVMLQHFLQTQQKEIIDSHYYPSVSAPAKPSALRQRLRRAALLMTLLGSALLSTWYALLLRPLETLLVLTVVITLLLLTRSVSQRLRLWFRQGQSAHSLEVATRKQPLLPQTSYSLGGD